VNATEAPKLKGQKRMLWRIFKPKREEVTGGQRKLHSDIFIIVTLLQILG
jgi:hypothetical protein